MQWYPIVFTHNRDTTVGLLEAKNDRRALHDEMTPRLFDRNAHVFS